MLWNLLADPVANLIGKFVEDKDKTIALKGEIEKIVKTKEAEFVSYQRDIIVAEAKSDSWAARNWRPIMMLTFVFIVFNNHVLAAWIPSITLVELPPDMWTLLQIGLGGYIVGRSGEKIAKTIKK